MKNVAYWTLVCLNVVLLVGFVARMSRPNVANAQVNDRPGDYLMIPGSVVGGVNDVVYVLDQSTRQLGAMSYDDPSHSLVPMRPSRDLDRDFDSGNRRR